MMKKRLLKIVIGFCLITIPAMFFSMPAFAKAIEITINDHNPAEAPPGKALDHWAKEVEKQCGGRVKITVHHGGALLKGDEAFRGIQTGLAHGGHYVLDSVDGFLLNTVMSLPFMGWPAQKETGQIYKELMNKFPELVDEWKGIKVIGIFMMPPTHIHNKKKVVKTPQDIKGMKLHCAESGMVTAAKAAGATAVEMDIADMYMSLDRGLIDGIVNHFPVLFVFGVLKLPTYHTIFGGGGINMVPMTVIMNAAKFNSLPPDIQQIFANSGPIWSDMFLKMDLGLQMKCLSDVKEWNHTLTNLSPEEIKPWYDLVKGPVHDEWIKDAETKGLPAKAVYEEALRLIKKYQK